MISVTIAAQTKSKLLFGGNVKAYGAGRLPLDELEKSGAVHEENQSSSFFGSMMFQFHYFFKEWYSTLCLLFTKYFFDVVDFDSTKKPLPFLDQTMEINDGFDGDTLLKIFEFLPQNDLLSCKMVCRTWNRTINNNRLICIPTDQIKILFDEGEIIIYPIDEKKTPVCYQLPPLQILQKRLSCFTTQSLFIRGLIPTESLLVVKMMLNTNLNPHQLYFIWCKFSIESVDLLKQYMKTNSSSINDFGLEDCAPSHLFNDDMLSTIRLTSLRLWKNQTGSLYGVTDKTLYQFTENMINDCQIETIDLNACHLTSDAVATIIKVWKDFAVNDLTIMLRYCYPVSKEEIVFLLQTEGIYLTNDEVLISQMYTLKLIC